VKLRHIFALPLFIYLISLLIPLREEELIKPPSLTVYSRKEKLLRAFLSSDDKWRIHVKTTEVSPKLIKTLISIEDRTFYYHNGVNPYALLRACYLNIKHGKIVSGGSTITMQVARMMKHRERTFLSKFIEILTALKLEILYSKEEILEMYINLLPYGSNVEGVGTASCFYFHKGVSQLSFSQSAMFAIIPNSPSILNDTENIEELEKKRNKILKKLLDNGTISVNEYNEGIREKIEIENPGMPFLSPHFTDFVHQRCFEEKKVITSLDLTIQEKAEKILKRHLFKWRQMGIKNGAVVIIDNKNQEILSMVGSNSFWDKYNSGQVNGCTSPRSPGSTLKPFLYAFAMDKGLITSKTKLIDVPVNYGEYSPDNYDGEYHGLVSIEEALSRSMNVPAVNLLAEVKPKNFSFFLNSCGLSTINADNRDYGLSLILGGCEVELLELTSLYSTLANKGIYSKYSFVKGEEIFIEREIFSEETAFIISEMLSELTRPDLPDYWEYTRDMPKIAWKTGTSYGHRDAWSIGYTRNYTVGVWAGNFEGSGAPELVGSKVAAPILFDLLRSIIGEEDRIWFDKPDGVREREVCLLSGKPPNKNCSVTGKEYYIPGISPEEECDMHKAIYVDKKTGYRLTKLNLEEKSFVKKVYEVYPPEVATWMERNNIPVPEIPEIDPESKVIFSGEPPVINFPKEECTYLFRTGIPLQDQKIYLDAAVSNTVKKIFWFLDGKLIWSGEPKDKAYIYPITGTHKLVCQDDAGRSSSINLRIEY
jgi:penicillin-binding protein 1C